MPTIALIICIAFVLYMLWLDRKQSPEVSFVFWIPTVWFLILCSKPLSIWLQTSGHTIEEGNPIDRAFLTIIMILGLTVLIKRKLNWSYFFKDNIWLMIFLGYMLLGCLWAGDPFISFKRWTREIIAIIMVTIIASEPNPLKAMECLLRRSIYVLIPFSFVLINYFGEYGRLYVHNSGDLMWIGAAMHKNSLIQLCVTANFFLIWSFLKRFQGRSIPVSKYQTPFEIFILLISFWVMGGPNHSFNYSATATVVFIVGLLSLTGLYLYKKQNSIPSQFLLTIFIIIIITYGTITPFIGQLSIFDVSSTVGREENLTGRTDVWRQLIPVALQQPLFGYGFAGFWTTSSREAFDIPTAHNGYLDLILTLGFAGLLFYSIFLVNNIRKAHKMLIDNFDWGVFWICSLVMALVGNISESSFISFESRIMVIILCLTFAAKSCLVNLKQLSTDTVHTNDK